MPHTLVSFHAHPDDEVLLTGGTLARASADGHRVVLVVATNGEAGLASAALSANLGGRRVRELEASAEALGCARLVLLGYPDSGWRTASAPPDAFSRLDPAGPAAALASVLRTEGAEVLTTYDPHGGYGHPDHVQVHRVGVLAAASAATSAVLEATIDRELLQRVVRLTARVPGLLDSVRVEDFDRAFASRDEITHRVDVHRHLAAKRRAMAAHTSQATSDGGLRTLALLRRLPPPVRGLVLGREWFVQRGLPAGRRDDVFAGVP